MVLAENLFGWYVGLAVAFALIVVVVAIVATLLSLASRIGLQAQAIAEALEKTQAHTAPLWDVQKVNNSGMAILKAAQTARAVVGG
jgi:hypothetical protein